MSGPSTEKNVHDSGARRAGAFDIRVFIASLIGAYGVVILVVGLFFTGDAELDRADGLNINLYAGLGMVVVSAAFIVWARLRPVIVPEDVTQDEGRDGSREIREGE